MSVFKCPSGNNVELEARACSAVHSVEARACWKLLQKVQERNITRVLCFSSFHDVEARWCEKLLQYLYRRIHEVAKFLRATIPG